MAFVIIDGWLKKIVPCFFVNRMKSQLSWIVDFYATKSYAQEGEDLVLRRFFKSKNIQTGFYVDIGAHHPKRFSNTFFFYKQGWRGINIDATPGSMAPFRKSRSRDVNLEYAVAESIASLPYYLFKEPALNTFSKDLADQYIAGGEQLLREERVTTCPLATILNEHLPPNRKIDFMSVDTEGFDLQVLKSNDWYKYRPTVLLVEDLDFDLAVPGDSELHVFMTEKGYRLFAKTINTLFYSRVT